MAKAPVKPEPPRPLNFGSALPVPKIGKALPRAVASHIKKFNETPEPEEEI